MKKTYNSIKLLAVMLFTLGIGAQAQTPVTYNYTGSVQTYTVPICVTSLTVNVQGAAGGANGGSPSLADSPGHGGCVTATLAVTPGQVLYIYTGGKGAGGTTVGSHVAGGWPNGGMGSNDSSFYGPATKSGGGGGGSSDIRLGGTALSARIIVGAGGGGAGYRCGSFGENGGDGGTLTGQTGGACVPASSTGGGGGTQTTGGAGGTCTSGCYGLPGGPGALFTGGSAGGCCDIVYDGSSASGGGGGGYYGGGAGQWTGGGGGSNYFNGAYASGVTNTRGCNAGYGVVTITPTCTTPAITGTTTVCFGFNSTLSDACTGGVWSSSNTGVASIDPSSGFVSTGVAGTATISYTAGPCVVTTLFTVNPLPSPIVGTTTICAGLTTSLSDPDAGGTWSSSNATVATVTASSGAATTVTAVTAGTATITYTFPTGCINTRTVLVNPLPAVITGSTTMCQGLSTTVSDITSGGTWSSTDGTIATIDAGGNITGVSAGTTTITFTISATGCIQTQTVLVNPLPTAILGADSVCQASSVTLSDTTAGGTWTSGVTATATVGGGSGIVHGVSAGTTPITYTITATGCITTVIMTVNPLPSSISGTTTFCQGDVTTLSDATGGGVWRSSNTSVASIDSVSGALITGAAGVATITYMLPTSCYVTTSVLVNPVPGGISGTTVVCQGQNTSLSDGLAGGTWSSSDGTVATVGSGTGNVGGVGSGTAIITYKITTSGCYITTTVTVNPRAPIAGFNHICVGLTTTLSNANSGGAWNSSNTSVATIDAVTGDIGGVANGTTTISYTLSTGCLSTMVLTVNPLTPILGTLDVCAGLCTTLSDATAGGTWSSSSSAIAIVGTGGSACGTAAGTTTITYTLGSGCQSFATFTVFPLPSPISGGATLAVCQGSNISLTDADAGGTWISGNASVATVDLTLGTAGGVAPGTSMITYTLPTGCISTSVLTVNPIQPILGVPVVCAGSCITLSDAIPGGAWSSSDPTVAIAATLGSTTGQVCGIGAGTAMITYDIVATGCLSTVEVTVNPLPGAIAGFTRTVCQSSTISLASASSGGTWTSSNIAVATVAAGPSTTTVVSGASGGTSIITYTLPTGCYTTTTVTVNPITPILGTPVVCLGSCITLTDATPGGTWSSSDATVATASTLGSASGQVCGVASGTATITYHMPSGCEAYVTLLVNPIPAIPTGPTSICVGTTGSFSDVTGGGTWSSSPTTIATIGSGTGTSGGVSAGIANITYTLATGCYNTTTVTIYNLAAISGPTAVCLGSCITLSDIAAGGTWSSSTTSVATIGTSGTLCGITAGTTVVTYALPTGCMSTTTITVNPLPTVITGAATVCAGSNITWFSGPTVGSWVSGTTAAATVTTPGTTTTVHGVAAGTSTITFTLSSTGCSTTRIVTVNPIPLPITGTLSVCQFQTTTLSDASGGGTWSATPGTIATIVSGTGVAGGVAGGNANITYTFTATGCYTTAVLTVHPTPAITGSPVVCQGSCITLTETIAGGTWSSSATGIATASTATATTGTICGLSAGTATITYTFPTGCISTVVVTVNPLPVPITGPTSVCQGANITLTDTDPGGPGTWTSGTPGVATVIAGPAATTTAGGVSGGIDVITFTLPTGCYTTYSVTVNPITPILGNPNICLGSTTSLSDATAGGAWSSSNTLVATVTTTGGATTVVSGATVGTSVITYLMPSGCSATMIVTVNPNPAAITGPATVCAGSNINLADVTPGGTWTSGATAIATVFLGPASPTTAGGVAAGVAVITYTLPTACYSTMSLTVLASPSAITGTTAVCIGLTTTLSDLIGGGTWTSSRTSVATVTTPAMPTTVTGVSSGTSVITYQISNGCYSTVVVTVNVLPSGITGTSEVCAGGSTVTLSDPVGAGTWSSSTGTVATVVPGPSSSTMVTGVGAGTATITYSLATGCHATYVVTVLAQPNAVVTPLSSTDICPGNFVVLNANTGILLTYQWLIGGAPIPGATASSYVAYAGGSYKVQVTAGSTGCSQTSAVAAVTVRSVTATVTVPGGTTTACASPGVTMDAAPAGMTYQWELGTTPIVGATAAAYTGSITGTYNVIVTNTYGCSDTVSQAITINPSPDNTVTLSGPLSFCSGDSVVITGTSGAGYTYQWNNTSGPIAGATNMAYAAAVSGTYWVVITNSSGCSTPSVQNVVAVTAAPVFTVTASGITTFCAGGNVTLAVTPTAGFTFQWYVNGSPIPGANTSSYTTSTTGSYSVKVTSGATGCSTFSPVTPVASITSPAMTPLSATVFCWGGSAPLTATVVGGTGVITYQWYVNGSLIPGATSHTYNATVPGLYNVVIDVPASCYLTSANISVTENPLPDPIVHFDGVLWFSAQGYFVTYQWYKNSVAILGATGSTTRATGNGNYKVAVTDTNGCQSVSDVYPLTGWIPPANVGVANINGDAVRIYPNPAANTVHIEAPADVRAVILGLDGKTLIDRRNAVNIDISSLADGVYIIRVYDDSGEVLKTEKLVKTAN